MTSWIKSNFDIQRFSAIWHQLSFPKSHLTLGLSFPTCKLWFMWFSLNLIISFLLASFFPVFKTWFKCRAFCTPTPFLFPPLCTPPTSRGRTERTVMWILKSLSSFVLQPPSHLQEPHREYKERKGKTKEHSLWLPISGFSLIPDVLSVNWVSLSPALFWTWRTHSV